MREADSKHARGCLLVLLAMIAAGDFAFAIWMPPVARKGKTGLLSGIVGAAGGIGGFYLPVIMGIAKESTSSYQMGFATFGVFATCAFGALFLLRGQWLRWSATATHTHDGVAINGAHAMDERRSLSIALSTALSIQGQRIPLIQRSVARCIVAALLLQRPHLREQAARAEQFRKRAASRCARDPSR